MKNTLILLIFIFPIIVYGQSEPDPLIDFDNVRFSAGKILSDVENKEAGIGLGLSTEYTMDKYFFGGSADFDMKTKKFVSLTFELGGGMPAYLTDDMDFFLGISMLSINSNAGPFNSALLLKLRYKQLIFESKTTLWNWQKGKDPVFKENGYYGITYRLVKDFAVGVQYRLYAEDTRFLNVHIGLMF
jgi:hypothetical protein